MVSLRCLFGRHKWEPIYQGSEVRGFGSLYFIVGRECSRCGLEVG